MSGLSKREWEKWWERNTEKDFPRGYVKRWKGETISYRESPVRSIIRTEGLEGYNVLDVGCASCIDYEYFKNTGVKYVGVDLTRRYLDAAKELYPEIEVYEANVVHGLPFEDGSFDMVYLKSVLEHLHPEEWRKAIDNAWRIARKKLMLIFFIPPVNEFPVYEYKEEGFWNNRLDKRELLSHLKSLEGYDGYKLYENVIGNDLYVVYRDNR